MNNRVSSGKTVVTVSEMARQVGLSRQRFHQLRRQGVFPEPEYDCETDRPFYDEETQTICREVRQRNCGVNGKRILFYARRTDIGMARQTRKLSPSKKNGNQHGAIIATLKGLGLGGITVGQVTGAITSLFPNGTEAVDDAEVVRSIFLRIKVNGEGE